MLLSIFGNIGRPANGIVVSRLIPQPRHLQRSRTFLRRAFEVIVDPKSGPRKDLIVSDIGLGLGDIEMMAVFPTTALPITSAGRFSPQGPLGIAPHPPLYA